MNEKIMPYAHVIIRLLQGVVYNDNPRVWGDLINYHNRIKDYFHQIGVELFFSESEGFAFLKNSDKSDKEEYEQLSPETALIPDLFSKRQFGYRVTLLSVLLLERLVEFDTSGGDLTRLILSKEEIKELLRVFLPDTSNEAKYVDSIDSDINKLTEYGFLKKLNNNKDEYEVKRILKAKIDASMLVEIKEKLEEYVRSERT